MSDVQVTAKKDWQIKFIKELCRTGNVSAACRKAKVSRKHAYETRQLDVDFAEAWAEALIIATEALEEEARRRAYIGVLEPVFYEGKQVAKIRKYSDTLMIFLLKAHRPDKYRENSRVEHVGDGGGAIKIEEVNGATDRILSRIDSIASKLATSGSVGPNSADSGG